MVAVLQVNTRGLNKRGQNNSWAATYKCVPTLGVLVALTSAEGICGLAVSQLQIASLNCGGLATIKFSISRYDHTFGNHPEL
jgi:hypothetical protein